MTTIKTGDLTKAQIVAKAADVSKIQWNKNLGYPSLKAILTAVDYVPADAGDWTTSPATIDAALDELAARTDAGAETDVANVFTAVQTIDNELAIRFREATANGTNYVAVKAPTSVASNVTLTLPAATDTLATLGLAEAVTGVKTFSAANVHYDTATIVDADAPTKIVKFDCGTQSAGTTTIIPQGTDVSVTLPATTATLATLGLAETFSGVKTFSSTPVVANAVGIDFLELTTNGTNKVTVKSPDDCLGADKTVVLPNHSCTMPAADGSANQVLITDGSGVWSFASATYAQQEATGTISSAEILALNATPKELIPAPGAGKILVVDEIELFMDFGSAAYVRDGGDEELVLQYSGGVDVHAFANATDAFLTAAADVHRIIRPVIYDSAAVNFIPSGADNEAVVAYITNSEVITGDSDLKYKIRYRTITLLT
jgi:hypothetical protein